MPHLRQEIRSRVVDILKSGNTLAGQRVYASRVRPGIQPVFPMIAVYTPKEDAKNIGINPDQYERDLELVIECVSEDIQTDVETKLDILLNQIEALIDTDENMIPNVSNIEYLGTTVDLYNVGERDTASGIIRYSVKYYTEEFTPDPGVLANVEVNGEWMNPI